MPEIEEGFRRVNLLVQSLRALLECCCHIEDNETTISSCIFLTEELIHEMRKLEETMTQLKLNTD